MRKTCIHLQFVALAREVREGIAEDVTDKTQEDNDSLNLPENEMQSNIELSTSKTLLIQMKRFIPLNIPPSIASHGDKVVIEVCLPLISSNNFWGNTVL